jgi:hypothetical protein
MFNDNPIRTDILVPLRHVKRNRIVIELVRYLPETLLLVIIQRCYAGVAQLFRARPCQGRGQGLESLYPHQLDT